LYSGLLARKGVWQGSPDGDERYRVDGVLELDEASEMRCDVTDHGHDDADHTDREDEAQVTIQDLCENKKVMITVIKNYSGKLFEAGGVTL